MKPIPHSLRRAALAACAISLAAPILRAEETKEAETPTEVAVHVASIKKATLRDYVTAYGRAEPEPASAGKPAATVNISAAVPGMLTAALCIEGERVEQGDPLFQLDNRLANLAVEKAKSAVEFAEKNVERKQTLLKVGGTSEKLLQEAEEQLVAARKELSNAETQRSLLQIPAPIKGTIALVNGKPGESVDTTSVLAELIDLDRLVVTAGVPTAEAVRLKSGQPVEIPTAKGTESVHGKLAFISPQVDTKTDTVLVRVALPADSGLKPGQFVQVRIVAEQHEDRLAVPSVSVVKVEDGTFVISLVDGDKATQHSVKIGLRDGGLVEVQGDGLKENATVVTLGAYGLPKETKIRLISDK